MTSGVFLSTASVVALLAGVALLTGLSALMLALLDRYAGRYVAAFSFCLVGIWLGAVVAIVLITRTI